MGIKIVTARILLVVKIGFLVYKFIPSFQALANKGCGTATIDVHGRFVIDLKHQYEGFR